MSPLERARVLVVILLAFLALTAVTGGIGLLTSAIDPGADLLRGSFFRSYAVPGLALQALYVRIGLGIAWLAR